MAQMSWSQAEPDLLRELYRLYSEQELTVDELPYTTNFDFLVARLNSLMESWGKELELGVLSHRRVWKLLIHARKNKKNPLPKKTTRKTGRDDNPFKGKVKGFGFSK